MTASKLINTTGETITLRLKTGGSIKINPGQSAIVSIQQVREINKMIKNKRKNLLITNQDTDKDFVNVDDVLNSIPVPKDAEEITLDEAKKLEESKLTDEQIQELFKEEQHSDKEDVKDDNTKNQPSLDEEQHSDEEDVKDEDVKDEKKSSKKSTKKKKENKE